MPTPAILKAEVVIFGGGCAGLWLLDELRRRNVRALLLETSSLGNGQTIASQGILHGGLKYSLGGVLSLWAEAVRDMPAVWRASLEGAAEPNLSKVALRARGCYVWRTNTLKSWAATLGAAMTLKVRPVAVPEGDEPAVLDGCPRPIYHLDEPVIDPHSFLKVMAERNVPLIWRFDQDNWSLLANGGNASDMSAFRISHPTTAEPIQLRTRYVVALAGAGNEALRLRFGLPSRTMQRRPLRIGLVRGDLPQLNGHCIEGSIPKVTITSAADSSGRTVWHLGGLVGETGATLSPTEHIRHLQAELAAALPGWTAKGTQWATMLMDRAEGFVSEGKMPHDVQIFREGNIVTAWPTKLVLAPRLSDKLLELIQPAHDPSPARWRRQLEDYHWPSPPIAKPFWEEEGIWNSAN